MSKFVIDNVLIEKSEKDITCGINYRFSSGFNLICGNNEAGKSSLMEFIKYGFLKEKDNDKGKIFFRVNDKNYRADVDGKKQKNKRLTVFCDDVPVNDELLLQKFTDEKYLRHAYTINLDNLMSLQADDKNSLVNVIKDPLSDNLNLKLEDIRLESKKIFTENNQLSNGMKSILEEIKNLTAEINKLSSKENEYNSVIAEIKMLSDELEVLNKNEKIVEMVIERKNLEIELSKKLEECNKLNLIYNDVFYNNRETYFLMLENVGKYHFGGETVKKLEEKYLALKHLINDDINKLNLEYSLNMTESDIKDFLINPDTIKKIKELTETINKSAQELTANKTIITNLEDNILKLNTDLSLTENKKPEIDEFESEKRLYKFLEEGLNQYNFVLNEISQKEDKFSGDYKFIKRLNISFVILIVLAISASIISFCFKEFVSGAIISFVVILGICLMYVLNKNNTSTEDKGRLLLHKNNILKELETNISNYEKVFENSNLIARCNSIKSELQNKMKDYEILENNVEEKKKNIQYIQNKLDNHIKIQSDLEESIDFIQNQMTEQIKSDNKNFDIVPESYLRLVDLISGIKNAIDEKNNVEKEIQNTLKINEDIKKSLNTFILDNSVDIPLTENVSENIENLKKYYIQNIEVKKNIDILEGEIGNLKSKIEANVYDESFDNVSFDIEERNQKQKQKTDVEAKKKLLEAFEGLSDLKLKKNIKLSLFRKKVQEVMKYKMVLALSRRAKKSFDGTKPDLVNAQKYLSLLTGEKYSKINLELEEISNDDYTVIKKWSELSRGTKEQLYLALRLGYASNYSKDGKTGQPNGKPDLPIIIDDAFVNFDSARTKNALKCLMEFSKTNQVLFFTCHSDTIKKHLETISDNQVNIIYVGA